MAFWVLLQKSVISNIREALSYGSFTLQRAAGEVGTCLCSHRGNEVLLSILHSAYL